MPLAHSTLAGAGQNAVDLHVSPDEVTASLNPEKPERFKARKQSEVAALSSCHRTMGVVSSLCLSVPSAERRPDRRDGMAEILLERERG